MIKEPFSALAIFIILSLMFTLLDFRHQIELSIGNYPVVTEELSSDDVIHVIAGSDYRTEYAIRLHEQGYAKQQWWTDASSQQYIRDELEK